MLHATAAIPGCYRWVSARAAAIRNCWKRDFPNKLASAAQSASGQMEVWSNFAVMLTSNPVDATYPAEVPHPVIYL